MYVWFFESAICDKIWVKFSKAAVKLYQFALDLALFEQAMGLSDRLGRKASHDFDGRSGEPSLFNKLGNMPQVVPVDLPGGAGRRERL